MHLQLRAVLGWGLTTHKVVIEKGAITLANAAGGTTDFKTLQTHILFPSAVSRLCWKLFLEKFLKIIPKKFQKISKEFPKNFQKNSKKGDGSCWPMPVPLGHGGSSWPVTVFSGRSWFLKAKDGSSKPMLVPLG